MDAATKCIVSVFEELFPGSGIPTANSSFDAGVAAHFMEESGLECAKVVRVVLKSGSPEFVAITFDYLNANPLALTPPGPLKLGEIDRLLERLRIHTLVVPSHRSLRAEDQEAFSHFPRIRPMLIRGTNGHLGRFVKMGGYPIETLLAANETANEIMRQFERVSHIILSDVAAPSYDEGYKNASAGTTAAMALEECLLRRCIESLGSREKAVELGCGTGRHSFILADHFEEVLAYDFSRGMIEAARGVRTNKIKAIDANVPAKADAKVGRRTPTKVKFEVRDVEMYFPQLAEESVDLYAGLFGMGSFVGDLHRLIVNIHQQLKPDGRMILSFYNRMALPYQMAPPWRHLSLSAKLDSQRNCLEVTIPTEDRFVIFCRPYDPSEIRDMMSLYCDEVEISTFPIISSLMPKEYIDRSDGGSVRQQFAELDQFLLDQGKFEVGNYIVASGRKSGSLSKLIQKWRADCSNVAHVRGLQLLGLNPAEREPSRGERQVDSIGGVVFLVRDSGGLKPVSVVKNARERVSLTKLAAALEVRVQDIRALTRQEIRTLIDDKTMKGNRMFPVVEGKYIKMIHDTGVDDMERCVIHPVSDGDPRLVERVAAPKRLGLDIVER